MLNPQKSINKDGSISLGVEWTHYFGPGSGFTWNPVKGCYHRCQWLVDGKIAGCYANDVALGVAREFYPNGFEHHYFEPDKLDEPRNRKKPAGIFLDSMSDLMGHWVADEEIQRVLNACANAPQHVFFLLTKNAPRLEKFEFPTNVWCGVSAPPSFMFGKPLTREQQQRYLHRSYESLERIKGGGPTWLSIEPLSWDVAHELEQAPISWAVLGAASDDRTVYQPEPAWVKNALAVLDANDVKVFYKGNLHSNRALVNSAGVEQWREEYPPYLTH